MCVRMRTCVCVCVCTCACANLRSEKVNKDEMTSSGKITKNKHQINPYRNRIDFCHSDE